jgi:DNA polymerase-3 subunit alpha
MGVSVGPGRGSAAGSIVSYSLGITNVDPLKYDLLFERFLNPERVSMPDIDVDFSDRTREKVIQYVREKYGKDSVSQIITFGTLSTKAVLKDVGRVLGIPLSTIDSITKVIPTEQGKVRKLDDAFNTIPELKWVKESTDPKLKMLLDASKVLEGMNRNAGMHAAGVVIAPGPISNYVPVYKTPQTEAMTQYNMKELEEAGLLKMDFLGLRTLSVLEGALAMIEEGHGVKIDLDRIPEDDAATFELFARGDTVGVFQFESSGMREWLQKLRPSSISDLTAMNALYRPGPMDMIGDFIDRKFGRQKITYLHDSMATILKETYGVIVYQEQVMRVASDVAGFSMAKADSMRRAMGKKDKALMATFKGEFIKGAEGKGVSGKVAEEIFDHIEKFASYGFNKSHSVAYSVLAYQTAYLKSHYAAEFMAATLSSEINDIERIAVLIDDCRRNRITLLPPDVNESALDFTVRGGAIRFGLVAIKNVGENAVMAIIRSRTTGGPFKNLFDFCERVDLRIVNKKCIESLIQAGAFDTMGQNRAQFLESIESACAFGLRRQSEELSGQSALFQTEETDGGGTSVIYPPLADVPPWTEFDKLQREKSVLGFYVSGHPLLKYERLVKEVSTVQLGDVASFTTGTTVRVCGIVTSVKKKIDKRNKTMAFVSIEDFSGAAECIVFSSAYEKHQHELVVDGLVMVTGKGELNGTALKILVDEVMPLQRARTRLTRSVVLSVKLDAMNDARIRDLRSMLERYPGQVPCFLALFDPQGRRLYNTTRFSVEPSDAFVQDATLLLGADHVTLSSAVPGHS